MLDVRMMNLAPAILPYFQIALMRMERSPVILGIDSRLATPVDSAS
jgi:hypothetical protein